jgi:hypothetical protein
VVCVQRASFPVIVCLPDDAGYVVLEVHLGVRLSQEGVCESHGVARLAVHINWSTRVSTLLTVCVASIISLCGIVSVARVVVMMVLVVVMMIGNAKVRGPGAA